MEIKKVERICYNHETTLYHYLLEDGTEVLVDDREQELLQNGDNFSIDYLPDMSFEPIYHIRENTDGNYEVEQFVVRSK